MLMKKDSAFLFPGNSISYSGILEELGENIFFRQNCKIAKICCKNNSFVSQSVNNQIDRELFNQKLIYTICCSICDFYKEKALVPAFVSGYSMGIYAAFYGAGAYTFENGLLILEQAFCLTKDLYLLKRKQNFGMGKIIGLSEDNIYSISKEIGCGINIACFNGIHNFIVVGEAEKLALFLKKAIEWGALKAERIDTGFGYHTPVLKEIADDFRCYLERCDMSEPYCNYLSAIDMNLVATKNETIDEIVKNIYSPVRWMSLLNTFLNDYNISTCYEVGPSDSLAKMARYINKELKVYPFAKTLPFHLSPFRVEKAG